MLPTAVGRAADPIPDIETVDLTDLLRRIGDARLVLLGAGSHGTSEYYQMRQRITRELIQRENFRFVAAEADKADAESVDAYVRRGPRAPDEPRQTFSRFPTWMWRNIDVLEFVEWLRTDNDRYPAAKVAFHGLDYSGTQSWNLRSQHMFNTLQSLMDFHGPTARGVVWAHNSHLGDARATSMAARGRQNLGQLVRQAYGDASYAIGFGTDHGTVTAAPHWGAEAETMKVRPSHPRSYEYVCHLAAEQAFLLPLRAEHAAAGIRESLMDERLERAIGVIYRPGAELASHYFSARLPAQFDEYCWFDATTAVVPLADAEHAPLEPGHPFAALDI